MTEGIEFVDRETLLTNALQMRSGLVEQNLILLEGHLERRLVRKRHARTAGDAMPVALGKADRLAIIESDVRTDHIARQTDKKFPDRQRIGTLPEPLKRGRARWINTGGMIPIGCDAVIAAASPDDRAAARQAVASERHVLRRGADRRRGEVILRKGTRLGVRETALLSEACIEEVQVSRTPRILILATGSEITMGPKNPVACRRASNAVYLQALLDAAGIEQSRIVRLPDDADEIARALERRVGIDLIVSIGGTGRGTHDLTRRAIAAAGGTVIEGTGDVKGAPPFVLADLGGTPLVGLPGNPLGAVMIIQRVLLPMLEEDFGLTLPRREVVDATLACDADIDAEGDLCVTLDRNEEGRLVATPVRKGSCRTRLFAVEAGTVSVKPCCLRAGEMVTVERFFN